MKKVIFIVFFLVRINSNAQDLSYGTPDNNYYQELPNPTATVIKEWQFLCNDVIVSFADDNIRYSKEKIPSIPLIGTWEAKAWKGEKIHTQILVWSNKEIPELTCEVGDLFNKEGNRIKSKDIKAAFVRYVMADEYGGGCNRRETSDYDSSLVADPIDIIKSIPVSANTVQPIWLSIEVPGEQQSGTYEGAIIINTLSGHKLDISINVLDHVLPPPGQWKFDLDIWQHPSRIARMHGVRLWSKEHFELMRPYFTLLAKAGQKVITANIIEKPWNRKHKLFEDPSLIKWIRKKDGNWKYDYSLFDQYISFMMDCGINQRINCYSMINWDLYFTYFDEALENEITFQAEPGTTEYEQYWIPMLKDFTEHLKTKGWFDITAIAIDERPLKSLQVVISLLKQIDSAWKVSLAADSYHPELENDIYDYSLASYLHIDENSLSIRKNENKPTTFYTACKEKHLAPYTFSSPAECTWLGWLAAKRGYTGYLFWAFNKWNENPLIDSRYKYWPSGTCYLIYPGPRTSIRFEKIIEGIQDFEKIKILREGFLSKGETGNLKQIDKVLNEFEIYRLDSISASEILVKAKLQLNSF